MTMLAKAIIQYSLVESALVRVALIKWFWRWCGMEFITAGMLVSLVRKQNVTRSDTLVTKPGVFIHWREAQDVYRSRPGRTYAVELLACKSNLSRIVATSICDRYFVVLREVLNMRRKNKHILKILCT